LLTGFDLCFRFLSVLPGADFFFGFFFAVFFFPAFFFAAFLVAGFFFLLFLLILADLPLRDLIFICHSERFRQMNEP
jgi:hypothetical protein